MVGTIWAFLPAVIAIVLALATKRVYPSLFAGVLIGALLYTKGNPLEAFSTIVTLISDKLGGNGGILVFLVVLGIFAVLLAETGGTGAYGEWATRRIKTKRGALLSTLGLGCLIFVDDYFNCLTVGSVMRPVTDRHKVSRAKLAYIIDATAAPICIIAPISSWAAAVSGFLDGENTIVAFIKTIPFNLYALLTLALLVVFILLRVDFGKMKRNETIAEETGDLLAGETELPSDDLVVKANGKGRVWHLIVPVVILIVSCVFSMIYVGWGVEKGANFFEDIAYAFSNTDASLALGIGSLIALVVTVVIYLATRSLNIKQCNDALVSGFKSMVPAIFILVFAWSLSGVMGAKGGYLDARAFVEKVVSGDGIAFGLLPAIFFLLACGISFATGTSWGTFGILLGIVTTVTGTSASPIVILSIAAVLAGSVFGDHVSPISDTTIMASSGAQCNHIDHVRTQLPYAGIVAIVSFISYLISGLIIGNTTIGYGLSVLITLGLGALLLAGAVAVILLLQKRSGAKAE